MDRISILDYSEVAINTPDTINCHRMLWKERNDIAFSDALLDTKKLCNKIWMDLVGYNTNLKNAPKLLLKNSRMPTQRKLLRESHN